VHRAWLVHPIAAAVIALLWDIAVLLAAVPLGVIWSFDTANVRAVVGFGNSHWGPLFLLAMPAAALLLGLYLRLLDNALQTLDRVIRPLPGPAAKPFSLFLTERFRLHWAAWIFPLSVAVPIILTVIADGRDICAPLQSPAIPPSNELDWSTLGYLARPGTPPLWYFGFNIAAWLMQIFLAYCGMLVITLTAAVLGTVFRYGLGGKRVADLFVAPGATPAPERYRPEWDFTTRRCGLEGMDWVFLFFVGLNLFALVMCTTSILVNVYLKNGADVGSSFLALASMVLLPLATFWVFSPYFSNFPEELPGNLKDRSEYVKPSPWPFGSERLTWALITITSGLWLFLLYQVLKSMFRGFGK